MRDIDHAAAALAAAMTADPTFAADPPRLGRALLDLSPYDRLTRLLVLAAEVGVPVLVAAGAASDARAVLRDDLGLRPEVAGWIVEAWTAGARPLGADHGVTGPVRAGILPGPADAEAEPAPVGPGPPTIVRLGMAPEGRPVVAVISQNGVFVTSPSTAPSSAPVVWRRVATPSAPASRDVAPVPGAGGLVAYSTGQGLTARALTCVDVRTTPSGVRLGEARVLVPVAGEQARYPLLALLPDDMSVELLWTADRRQLRRTLLRDWLPGATTGGVPSPCGPQERLTGLHLARGESDPAWLVAATDRGRLLVTRWEVALESVGAWRPLHPPVPVTTASVALLSGRPFVLAGTAAGHLISADARAALSGPESWHSVDPPADRPGSDSVRLVAAVGGGPTGWLVAGDRRPWLSPLRLAGETVVAGPGGVLLPGL